MMRKLRSRRGESIAETMIALFISTLAMVMLAGALVAAARVNAAARSKESGASGAVTTATVTIAKSTASVSSNVADRSLWSDSPYETQVQVTELSEEGLYTYE